MICDNPLADHFDDYVLHTEKPKALFKVLRNDKPELTVFETIQEIDPFPDFKPEYINKLMTDLKQFYIDNENYMKGSRYGFINMENFEKASIVNLEDAYALSLTDSKTYQIPTNDLIERVTTFNYLKVCYNGQMFWCIVAEVNRKKNKILAYITEELPLLQKNGLDQGEAIIIEPHHIFEIQK